MGHANDYIGFTYGGVHSKDLNLYRVISGSRHDLQLHPVYNDKTTGVTGGDGMYYFGTDFQSRTFSLNLAYDNLTEEMIQKIRMLFDPKEVKELIFDENPYKIYSVKPVGNLTLNFIPFSEGFTGRLYKGEGSVQLVAYTPYARSRYKWREDYIGNNIAEWETGTGNLNEWIVASGIRPKGVYDVFASNEILTYNAGNVPTDFIVTVPFTGQSLPFITLKIEGGTDLQLLHLENLSKKGADTHLRIDTYLGVIEGLENGVRSGNLYNEFITTGNFFKLPIGESTLEILSNGNITTAEIEYNYLYY